MNLRYEEIFGEQKGDGVALTGYERGDVALLRTTQAMQFITPLKFGDSSVLQPWEPLITIGHPPNGQNRTLGWVGSFLGADYFTRTCRLISLPRTLVEVPLNLK